MFKKYRSTLKNEVFFINVISVMVISVLFIFLLAFAMYNMNLELAYQRLEKDNTFMATYTEGVFDTLAMSSEVLLEFMKLYDYESVDESVKKSIINLSTATKEANSNIIACYIGLESNGRLFNDFEVPSDYDARLRPWYKEALKTPEKVTISPPYKDITTNDWILSLSKPIIDGDGLLIGVAAVDFTLDFASNLLLKKGYYETQSNYMLNGEGAVYIHPNEAYINRDVDEIVQGLDDKFTSSSGFVEYTLEGRSRIAYYRKSDLSDWILVSAIDTSEVILPVLEKSFAMVLGLLSLAIVLGLIQVKIFERRFVKPINVLRDRITAITLGQKLVAGQTDFSNHELAEIARKIEEMAESSLREKAEELELILSSTSDGILLLNLDGKVIHANNRFLEIWRIEQAANLLDFSNTLLAEKLNPKSLEDKERTYISLHNGAVIEQNYYPVIEKDEIKRKLWTYRDVTEQFRAEEALKLMATTDALTGIWNRRHFMSQGQREFDLVKRTGLPLSMIFFDVDHFKRLNDTYGHSIGDEALKYLAQSVLKLIRSTDLFARVGGEEFCILAPNTTPEAAFILAEKVRAFFENSPLDYQDLQISFTLSLGIASSELEDLTFSKLIEHADKACYEAKSLGRNRVVIKRI